MIFFTVNYMVWSPHLNSASVMQLIDIILETAHFRPLKLGMILPFCRKVKHTRWQVVLSARRNDVDPSGAGRDGSVCRFLLLAQFVGPAEDAGPSFHHVQEVVGCLLLIGQGCP